MKRIIIIIILAALAYVAYSYFGKGNKDLGNLLGGGESAVMAYVPDDTLFFIGNLEAYDMTELLSWAIKMEPHMANEQLESLPELPANAAAGQKFVYEFYNNYTLAAYTDVLGFYNTLGVDPANMDTAFYSVQAIPVMRFNLDSEDAFEKFILNIEKNIGYTAPKEKKQNISFRRYAMNDGAADKVLELIVAQHEQQAVFTVNTPLNDDEDLYPALGVSKPAKTFAERGAKLAEEIQAEPVTFIYFDTLSLIKGMTNPTANRFGAMLEQFMQLAGDNQTGMSAIQTPACHKEFTEMVSRWPYFSGGYTKVGEKSAEYKMLFKMTESNFIEALKKLTGSIPKFYQQNQLPMYAALGLNVAEVPAFVAQLKADWGSRSYECEPLAGMQQSIRQMDTTPLAGAAMAQGLKGIGFGATKIGDIQAIQRGAFDQISAVMTLVADDPASLIAMAGSFFPPIQQLGLTDDGVVKEMAIPMVPVPLKVAMKTPQITLFAGEEGADYVNATEQHNDRLLEFGMDYKYLFELVGQNIKKTMPPGDAEAEKMHRQMENFSKAMNFYASFFMGVEDNGLVMQINAKKL